MALMRASTNGMATDRANERAKATATDARMKRDPVMMDACSRLSLVMSGLLMVGRV